MPLSTKDRHVIKEQFHTLNSKEELLQLLNKVAQLEYGDNAFPISIKQLNYYANFKLSGKKRYHHFEIPKKSGKLRRIHAPAKGLKTILRSLNTILHSIGETHPAAKGFKLGTSIADNAIPHVDKTYVYNTDLKDFFHSFEKRRIKGMLTYPPFNLSGDKEPLAYLIAGLCTHPLDMEGETKHVLPQGSPTSPTLTNFLCRNLDRRLTGLAKRFHLHYTRYADDITFSGETDVFRKNEFKSELRRIISDQGLEIQDSKTRKQKKGGRQEVTGLTVNEKVNVSRTYVKEVRQLLYYWERYGLKKASAIYTKNSHTQVNEQVQGTLKKVLRGKLEFMKMVKGDTDPTYRKLHDRYLRLNKSVKAHNLEKVIEIILAEGLEKGLELYEELKT